jgi:hypothetical protein
MSQEPASPEHLVAELDRLGVEFLRRSDPDQRYLSLKPARLLAGLAASLEARLRLALIPLLLWRPDSAKSVVKAASRLPADALLSLRCYYTAAMLLQPEYADRLHRLGARSERLPDLFSASLSLPNSGQPGQLLKMLAEHQAELSGEKINWLGTYRHAIDSFVSFKEKELVWSL